MPKDAFDQMRDEIEKRLARKTHADLLRVVVEVLKEEGEDGVKKEIKARITSIMED
jgi:flagellar basal body-associated protein FliL